MVLARVNGARAGNRTLNLGIEIHLTLRLPANQDVSGRLRRIRSLDAVVS
jgi:hypothetical protein